MTFDENVQYKDKTNVRSEDVQKVGVEVELQKNSQSDAIATPQENPKNTTTKQD